MFSYTSGDSNKYSFSSVKFRAKLVVSTTIVTFMSFCSWIEVKASYIKTSVTSSVEKKVFNKKNPKQTVFIAWE